MNANFTFIQCSRPIKGGTEPALQLCYKGEVIAIFRGIDDLQKRANDHIATYGYMSEWMRQRMIAAVTDKRDIAWSDDMFVNIAVDTTC